MRTVIRFLFLVVLFVSVGVIGYRVVYDFTLIRQGDTFVVKKSTEEGYDYLLHIPRGYNDYSGPQPLLIFLHGAGERDTDPRTLLEKTPAHFAKDLFKKQETSYFPFIVVTPICPESCWEPHRVIALLDQVLVENKFRFQVDPDRVYLTGYSMGGFGTFETAMEYPERFAAIVPVAGGGEPDKAEKLLDVATWVFHGENDTTVPIPSAALVVERMRELGHKDVVMTTFSLSGHGIAGLAYMNDSLYRWLLLKRKSRFGQEETFARWLPLLPPLSAMEGTKETEEMAIPDSLDGDEGVETDAPNGSIAENSNPIVPEEPQPATEEMESDSLNDDAGAETDTSDEGDSTEEPIVTEEADEKSFNDGTGSDAGDFFDSGLPDENLTDPVVAEEPHSE